MGDGETNGHALLVGSSDKSLRGVDHDIRCMAEMLRDRRFSVDVRTGERATREGILSGYDDLIAKVGPTQAAVFYYAGHGFRAFEDAESASWQGISPVDLNASEAADFRGITAWELSIKQVQLTHRTKNVTVILDCCYASQMSRDGVMVDAIPRVLPHPVRRGFAAHLAALRTTYGAAFAAVDPLGNRDAVRLVACGQDETAYEYRDTHGQYHGAFTAALLEVLKEVGHVPVSWAVLEHAIRGRVLRRFPVQRPDIEGPVRRRPFLLEEEEEKGPVGVAAMSDGFRLEVGRLMGVMPGDVYGVMPPGPLAYRAADAIAEVRVHEVFPTFAYARLHGWKNGHSMLPRNAIAVLAEKAAVRHAVRIDAPAWAWDTVKGHIDATRTLRLAESDEEPALATLRLTEGMLTIEDGIGSMFPAARFPDDLSATSKNLANLGVAQSIRELEGEHGVLANEVEIEWGAVEQGRMRRMPERGGALTLNEKVYVRVKSQVQRLLHVHLFNIGLRGKITLLTRFAPTGVALTSEEPDFVLGRQIDGTLPGIALSWPAGMPRETSPRMDEIVVIVTSTAASLRNLETNERLVTARGEGGKLQDTLAQLQDGRTRTTRAVASIDGFFVRRLWYSLYARDAGDGLSV
jgi:Caspase domain